jgi:hypothetical protein
MARSRFFKIRVTILSSILAIVVLYAIANIRSRRARNDWQRPLNVALVIVREGPVDPTAIDALRARMPLLEAKLAEEMHRHRPTPDRPFYFVLRGAVDLPAPLPRAGGDGFIDLAKQSWALSRWVKKVDERAGLSGDSYDARVYAIVRPPAHDSLRFVEGSSEQGGRIGTLEVDLDPSMVDFALFVSAHELFHTIGALDKYDVGGDPSITLKELEIMDRGRVDSLDILRVGTTTAREIGWIK